MGWRTDGKTNIPIITDRRKLRMEVCGVSELYETVFDRIDGEIETAFAGASTPNEGLTEPYGGSAMANNINADRLRRQLLAVEYLQLCAEQLEAAKRARVAGIIAAREHGLSWEVIGGSVGVSEAAVRSLIKRRVA